MILVTVGTSQYPFDRLLEPLWRLPAGEDLVVQHGPSRVRPPAARCVEFLSFDELEHEIERARVVVTHAGIGSLMMALKRGKRPITVPRLRRFGETVDDHQVDAARQLEAVGLVELVEDPDTIPELLADRTHISVTLDRHGALVSEIAAYVEAVCFPLAAQRPNGVAS